MNAVIKPWLSVGLVVALVGNVALSAALILKLSRYDEARQQAEETETRSATQRAELLKLQTELDTLTKQRDAIAPTVADWQQRLKEKAAAEAALSTMEAKQKQAESDVVQVGKRLEEVNRTMLEAEKQKADLASNVARLKSERDSLAKSNIDTKALVQQAEEAERRFGDVTNVLAHAEVRRKQFESEASTAQAHLDQVQKELEKSRQTFEKSNSDLTTLKQQIQVQKDILATLDPKAAELKALQSSIQQEEQKLAKLRQQSSIAEARTTEMEAMLVKTSTDFGQWTNRLDLARKDASAAEAKLESVKSQLQKGDADLAGDRAQSQVFVVKQGELTREASRLEATVERLKKEKELLEKEIGRLEGQRLKSSSSGAQ